MGSEWFPERKCGTTDDRSICTRGWGTYTSEEACCAVDGAFTEGCGVAEDADLLDQFAVPGEERPQTLEVPMVAAADGPSQNSPVPAPEKDL